MTCWWHVMARIAAVSLDSSRLTDDEIRRWYYAEYYAEAEP